MKNLFKHPVVICGVVLIVAVIVIGAASGSCAKAEVGPFKGSINCD